MFEPGTRVFLRFPNEGGRVLHAGAILASRDHSHTGVFFVRDQAIEVGVGAVLYFARGRDFLQLPVNVQVAFPAEDGLRLDLELAGRPRSADNRQSYRVSAITAGITATFGEEEHCEVIEVSESGLSLYAHTIRELGDAIEIILHVPGYTLAGRAVVINAKPISAKRVRYGLRSRDHDPTTADFERGLVRLAQDLQRDQLRRTPGS